MNINKTILKTDAGYQLGNLLAVDLTKRQAETLLLCARGKSENEAACELECSANRISQLKCALFNKLNANSTPELITRAFEEGNLQFLDMHIPTNPTH
jgi:DNA-binding CsgD family transcriptional regulator